MARSVLILGGAGFIGSHLVRRFVEAGWQVAVIDGLLSRTGGRAENLRPYLPAISWMPQSIELVSDLPQQLDRADIVIDAMAWTAHLSALRDPRYDLQLNVDSHLILLQAIKASTCRRIIYLGSRGQYGNPADDPVTEATPMEPRDIQGIHKVAAESHFRVFSALCKLDVLSLRLPNCFGERQPTKGDDIGLIGGFVRDALQARSIEVFGRGRSRCILYAGDLAEVVFQLASAPFSGFAPLNVGGHHVSIADLAGKIVHLVGTGSCTIKDIPDEIRSIDSGSAHFSSARLEGILGGLPSTPLEVALSRTIRWFQTDHE